MTQAFLIERLERVVDEWASASARRLARRSRRELLARDDECPPARFAAQKALSCLLALPANERLPWLDCRDWKEDGVVLGCLLLDEAEALPPAERIELPRLAARVSALSEVAQTPAFAVLLDDNLGRAGLMEVRALRRRGQLAEARAMFAELEAGFDLELSPRSHLLTLAADRALTAGLLALDEYRTTIAERHFDRCSRYQRVASTEEADAELLFGQARLDLLRDEPGEAVDRLLRCPPFESPSLRSQSLELAIRAALRTKRPSLARPLLATYTREMAAVTGAGRNDLVTILEAAVRALAARPVEALDLLAGPQRRLRSEGKLVLSLTAALIAARAELALRRPTQARKALAAGGLTEFRDITATPAICDALAEISAAVARPALTVEFLDRIDLWLLLVTASPGVGLAPQA